VLHGVPTLRQFMSHTSGYRCYLDLAMLSSGLAVQPVGEALAAQVRQSDVNFDPADGQLYNNGGFHMLSIAIERASGMAFEDFMKTRIYEPLGMVDTISLPSDLEIVQGIATLHTPSPKGGWRRGIFVTEEIRGEGAMVSTVDDMLRWLAHMNGPKLVGSDASWEQLKTPAVLKDGFQTSYALGLFHHDYRGVDLIHHGGAVIGGGCAMLTAPDHGLDLVMIGNGGPANLAELQLKIVDALLEDVLAAPKPVMAAAEPYKHLDGATYHHPSGKFFSFKLVGDKLGVSLIGMPPMPILRDEGEILRIGFEDCAMGPFVWKVADLAADADGNAPAFLDFSETGRVLRCVKLPATPPATLDVGAGLVGRYHCADLAAEGEISIVDGKLVATMQARYGRSVATIAAIGETAFTVDAGVMPGFSLGLTALPDSAGFLINSGRTRHLLFTPVAG
jgi:hypothetical protein